MNNRLILIIGLVWPEPKSSAAGKRMLQLISLFQKWNYKVVFASTALENEINFDLSTIGVEKAVIELNSESFDDFVKKCNPAIVLFDRFVIEEQFGWRVAENCPSALRILDSEDLHCLRYTRQASFKKGLPFHIDQMFEQDWTKREIASILRCDLTLIIAEFEMEVLKTHFKIDSDLLFYLPILFEQAEVELSIKSDDFDTRNDFMFIGNFWHEPNWDAVLNLKQNIWPLIIKKLPKAIIRIYGSYPSQKVFDLNNKKEGFLIMGRAEDAEEAISSAKVLLAPLRFGAGIKGKLVEAMQCGTPSVTTSIGSESINGNLPWNGFIANDANTFAENAVQVYEDAEEFVQYQQNGFQILQSRFQISDFEDLFRNRLELTLLNLDNHRNSNFYGALLLHHSMRSSKYMSKWIEEKNKKSF